MKVLTIFAHPNHTSFCHAILERFDRGLADAGHSNEIVDLYAIGFDPVFTSMHARTLDRSPTTAVFESTNAKNPESALRVVAGAPVLTASDGSALARGGCTDSTRYMSKSLYFSEVSLTFWLALSRSSSRF